jgi:plasmid stability protein
MANLTIVIDDQLLQAARIKALQHNTSVNEVCRDAIARFARHDDAAASRLAGLRRLAADIGRRGDAQPLWPGRDTLYREALDERGPVEVEGGPSGDAR